MIGPSSATPLPGIVSQYNDRLGRIFGPDTLEANWYEERLHRDAGLLRQPKDDKPVLRPFEPDLSATRSDSGGLAICSRQHRYPFMFKSRSVLSDGLDEKISMYDTFFKPIDERPPNPVGIGRPTVHDAMLMRYAVQHDEPKTRQSRDRMSNIENEVRPVADSDEKIRKRFINAANIGQRNVPQPSPYSALTGFGAVVPRHPEGFMQRSFSTTTGEALSTGLLPRPISVRASAGHWSSLPALTASYHAAPRSPLHSLPCARPSCLRSGKALARARAREF